MKKLFAVMAVLACFAATHALPALSCPMDKDCPSKTDKCKDKGKGECKEKAGAAETGKGKADAKAGKAEAKAEAKGEAKGEKKE